MKLNTTLRFIISVIVFVAVAPFARILAQETYFQKIPVYQFDLPGSLHGNEVQHIFQDVKGYMWYSTKNGLTRYDGAHFDTYRYRANDPHSVSINEVEKVVESQDGFLYVATWGGGLNRFDPQTEQFTRYHFSENEEQGVASDFVSDMVLRKDGKLWVATRGGLFLFDPQSETSTNYSTQKEGINSLKHKEIRSLHLDRQNVLWVGTGYPWENVGENGLYKYRSQTDDFVKVKMFDAQKELTNVVVSAIYQDSLDNLWIGGSENRVFLLNKETQQAELRPEISAFFTQEEHVRDFFEIEAGLIWVLSYGSGSRLLEVKKDKIIEEVYVSKKSKDFFFALNHMWQMYRSRDGVLWICTGDIGDKVYKSNIISPFLGVTQRGEQVNAVAFDANKNVWFGREWSGLYTANWVDWEKQSLTWLDDPAKENYGNWWQDRENNTNFDNAFPLVPDAESNVYFGKKREGRGLYFFNQELKTLENYRHNPTNQQSISADEILDMELSVDQKNLWILTTDGVLNQLNRATEKFTHYSIATHKNAPQRAEVLHFTDDKNLWLGGVEGNGNLRLTHFDLEKKRFTPHNLISEKQNIIETEAVEILETKDGTLWLCTAHSILGLHKNGDITRTDYENKTSGNIRAALLDDRDNIWLASTIGISVFNTKSKDVFTFPDESIHQDIMPFNLRSASNLEDEMTFCGIAGCAYITRQTIKSYYLRAENQATLDAKKIILRECKINGEGTEIVQNTTGENSRSAYVLEHDENNFSFTFSLLDYQNPKENRFEFYLENYDTYWRKGSDRNTAYFAQIPPGNYTLRVRAYNAVGSYAEITPLQIRITPPWYRTWWAYCLYVAAFFGLLFGVYRFQLRKSLAEAEARRLQDLDAAKSRLYTNITHEFRTPLTVILGMAKQMQGKLSASQSHFVEMITRNGQNLLNLVNQMLDLAKLESGQMQFNPEQGDLISYLKYLTESFHSFAESRSVKVHFLSELERQNMDFDPQKIQQIISNLLSNAIKFTPAGGDIYISVSPAAADEKILRVRIKDTGTGIAPERLPYIFERFYQADETSTRAYEGTGIGLALTAELVKLIHGTISVKSDLGKGTEFTLSLPVTQKAEQNTDLSYYDRAKIQFYREGLADDLAEKTLIPEPVITQKSTILIVEDNFDVRTYMRACLKDNYHLIMAENGQRGSEKAILHVPDLIISDIMMPLKDGYTLVRELKSDARTSHIPIVLLTAKADTDSRLAGLRQGADAYLAKPFNPEELNIRIEKLMELRTRLQQHYLGLGATSTLSADTVESNPSPEDAFVLQVKSVILDRLDDYKLDVQTLCREVNMSHSQLHRKLSALTGLSVNRYIRHLRLEKAKDLLRDPEQTVTAVAFETGYSDPSYFGRVFKKETGMTPMEWQQGGKD